MVNYKTSRNGEPYSEKINEIFKVNAGRYLPDLEEQLVGKEKEILYKRKRNSV